MEFSQACKNEDSETEKQSYSLGSNGNAFGSHNKKYFGIPTWWTGLIEHVQSIVNLIFLWICSKGYLKIAKLLHNLGADVHSNNEKAFIISCSYGRFEVAKWLYSMGSNIHANDEYAFISSCVEECRRPYRRSFPLRRKDCVRKKLREHVVIARWLYSLGVDSSALVSAFEMISVNINFDMARLRRSDPNTNILVQDYESFEVIEWLYELDSDLIWKSVMRAPVEFFDILKIGEKEKTLLVCIKNNTPFPPLEEIDDIIIQTLADHHMIDHLMLLKDQFGYIDFDVVDNKVTNLFIRHNVPKSARKVI